jgi:cyclic-di-GMP-binding biofilm dispersal mediator protein
VARPLAGASIVVAGASGGIGREIAALLAARGAQLTLTGRDPSRLAALALPHPQVTADLRDADAGVRVVTRALEAHGHIDGVVNAAGIVAFGDLVDTDPVVLEELFLVNVLGALWLAQAALPSLRARRGFLVHMSAVVAERPLPGLAGYSASKAALTAADHALQRELRRAGVSVIDARPPHTETGLAHHPIGGVTPTLPRGLEPSSVAARVVAAIEADERDLPSSAFGT